MYPLLFFSIVSLGIIIERLYRYLTVPKEHKANQILSELQELLNKYGSVEPIVQWCEKNKGVLGYVFLQLLKRFNFLVVEKRPILDMRNELLDTGEEAAEEYFEEFLPGRKYNCKCCYIDRFAWNYSGYDYVFRRNCERW